MKIVETEGMLDGRFAVQLRLEHDDGTLDPDKHVTALRGRYETLSELTARARQTFFSVWPELSGLAEVS